MAWGLPPGRFELYRASPSARKMEYGAFAIIMSSSNMMVRITADVGDDSLRIFSSLMPSGPFCIMFAYL